MSPHINLLKHKKRDLTISKERHQDIYNTPRWKRLRAAKIRDNPLCEDCEREGKVTLTEEVHHIVSIEINPNLAFDYDNLMSLCIEHHKIRDRK